MVEHLSELTCRGRRFVLRRPLEVEAVVDNGLHVIETGGPMRIVGSGASKAEAASDFAEDFCSAWGHVALAPDEALAPDALEMKRAMIEIVAAVEGAHR